MSVAMNLSELIETKGGTGTIQCPVLGAIAKKAGCSAGTLYMIAKGHKSPGPQLAKAIEQATGGEVTRHELRPDYFDPPAQLDSAA